LRKLGLDVQSAKDIEFVTDSVFGKDRLPTGFDRQELVRVFEATRALLSN
jgi:hypothetical protein